MQFTRFFLPAIIVLLFSYETGAQTTGASIKGKITELNGQALPHANISIDSLNINIISDINGYYTLNNLPRGAHNIKVEHVGYKPVTRRITVSDKIKSVSTLDVILEEEARTLQEVEIQAKTQAEKIRESGYSVNVIETQAVQDREVTLNQLVSPSTNWCPARPAYGYGKAGGWALAPTTHSTACRAARFGFLLMEFHWIVLARHMASTIFR